MNYSSLSQIGKNNLFMYMYIICMHILTKNTYMYTHTQTHTHIYNVYVFVEAIKSNERMLQVHGSRWKKEQEEINEVVML